MRIDASITSISWIPSAAVEGMTRIPFDVGVSHYDDPLPDVVEDLEALRVADRFRFANELKAWIEVTNGRIEGYGYAGGGRVGVTKLQLGGREVIFPAVALPDIQAEPEVESSSVRFVQTAGGRTGVPAPRRVRGKPFIQVAAPLAWTTLALRIGADGSSEHEVIGASAFPRHWFYDDSGRLTGKSGVIDFKRWSLEAFGQNTPWGMLDSPALVTEVESALERVLSRSLMSSQSKPRLKQLSPTDVLVEQGEEAEDLFLLLDGILVVEVDGRTLAEIGPGAILGERAFLQNGRRTATLRALTRCRVASFPASAVARDALVELARGHIREEA